MEAISPYESDSDSDHFSDSTDIDSQVVSQPRKRKRQRQWNVAEHFENKDDAIEFVSSEGSWSISYTNNTSIGRKVYYRCMRVKKAANCDAAIYLLYVNTSSEVVLYRTDAEHTCDTASEKNNRLSTEAKREIERLIDYDKSTFN